MTTYVLPTTPLQADWEQILNDIESPAITGALQVSGRTGNRWRVVLTYMNLTGAKREAMWGHLLKLKGRRNRSQVDMSTIKYVRGGAGGGTPLLVGAHSAGATSLSIDGASNSITNWLKAADYITIGNQLVQVDAAVNTNGSGQATLSIWPELHKNYADNTPVNISTPFGVFFLRDPGALNMSRFGTGWRDQNFALSLEQDVLA